MNLPAIEKSDGLVSQPGPSLRKWIDREEDYRRGFTHGIAYAVEMIQELRKKAFVRPQECSNIIENFNLRVLYPWRYRVEQDVDSGNDELMWTHPKIIQEPWWVIRNRILKRDGRRCRICGTETGVIQVDHIFPVSAGGLPSDDNLQVLCKICNGEKGCAE